MLALHIRPEAASRPPVRQPQRGFLDDAALDEAGVRNPAARAVHVCFGEGDGLQVFDVWESQEAFDKFGETLMPILAEKGIDPGEPVVAPVHNILFP